MPEGGIMIPEGGLQEGAAPLGDESMLQDEKQSPNGIGTIGGQDEGNAIYGKVDSIAGNQVILILGTYNEDGTLAYGDETATYLLPVGMAIGTGNFTSVTKGMVLRITLETLEDGSENITSVSIVSR
ncbi:hypothetical protein SDC9_200264 [bioreactor metagenome]|uniref:DUF5666 domain-containing protein n=1 Tax=bioreactor metagenome TaxID=1076179 RepID=A0A645IP19_9ZZZZ